MSIYLIKAKRKAQSSIEFMILVSAAMFFIIVFISLLYMQVFDNNIKRYNKEISLLSYEVKDEIYLANEASDGYFREFDVPQKIIGKNYSIQLIGLDLYIISEDEAHASLIYVGNVTGNIHKGKNIIKKDEGIVYLN
jgi:hypothetical protein